MAKLIGREPAPFKNILESISIVKDLERDQLVTLNKHGTRLDKALAAMGHQQRKFTISFENPAAYHFTLGEFPDVKIISGKHELLAAKIYIDHVSSEKVRADIFSFRTELYNETQPNFLRLIIPLPRQVDFFQQIAPIAYRTKTSLSVGCIRVKYLTLQVDLYLHSDKKANVNYLIIDASERIEHQKFLDYCFSTLVAFGYVTGKFPQDEGYIFSYLKPDLKEPSGFYYTRLRESIFSLYTPINSSAYGHMWIDASLHEISALNKTLRVLSQAEFSKVCQWAFDSVEFSSILLLVIEACSSSLLFMPSGLSIALEGMTELLVKKNEDKLAPIKDKSLARKIRQDLLGVVNGNSQHLSEEGLKVLKVRIENINSLTNASKLTKPFELLNFKLLDLDRDAINRRNEFLHGKLTLSISDSRSANNEVYYTALRLYTLLSVLILKSVGYDNKVVNYPMIHRKNLNKLLDEPYFRQV